MIPQISAYDGKQAIANMDVTELESVISCLLEKPVTVSAWNSSLLGGLDGSPMAGGVYKVTGTACEIMGETAVSLKQQDWTVVVKILRSPAGMTMPDGTLITPAIAEDQRHFGYWQRETFAAKSNLLADLPSGISTPQCLGITTISEGECWLWQAYLPSDQQWAWGDYGAAAKRLGQWQAANQAYKAERAWLSQQWLSQWVHGPLTNIFGMVEGMNGYNHPLLTAYFAPEELAALRQLWGDRQLYLDRLTQLPQTLCHLDAHRGNLSWQGDKLALLDWAFVGEGALGEELAAFIGATLLLDHCPLADADQLEQVAFSGYLAGLRDAGWSGDEAQIWEAYRCSMPLRYAPVSVASMLRTAVHPAFAAAWETKIGKPLANILNHRAGLVRFFLSRM